MSRGHVIAKPAHTYSVGGEVENGRVLLKKDGEVVVDIPYEMVDDFVRAIREKKLLCEEYAQAERIARDSAILLRAGARFVLSARNDIQDEAVKLACYDRALRQMPLIKSQERFGCPTFEARPPRPKPEDAR